MEYKEFLDGIRNGLQEFVGENGNVQIIQVGRNNGVKLEGLIVKDSGKSISPAIYLDIYYEQYKNGRPEADIINEIYQIYCKYSSEVNICVKDLADYGKISKKVAYRIINFEKNKNLLAEIPYVRFLDMAIVFFVVVQCQEKCALENAAFLIRDEHLKMWNLDIGEIYRDALYNTPELFPPKICCMSEILAEMISDEMKDDAMNEEECEAMKKDLEDMENRNHIRMYVLTNVEKINGAACILYKNVLKEFCKGERKGYYIIPSSVHEVLLIPADNDIRVSELKGMVKDVNETELEEEEILSDNIYYYDCEKDNISIA